MSIQYEFLPWVRQGLAGAIGRADDGRRLPAAVKISVGLRVGGRELSVPIEMYGPGDVTGINAKEVVRREPTPGTTDFEPNYFPAIEFDRPDFPWLFTPASAGEEGKLRPWLVLVVVERREGVRLSPRKGKTVPILTIEAPAVPGDELPDLSESWFWAHAQVTSTGSESLEDLLAEPESIHTVSRLIAPRHLKANVRYLACVVPSFEAGRLSGLGSERDGTAPLNPAWLSGAEAPARVELPVYHHWEFATGVGGDFESLAARLKSRALAGTAGTRTMAVTQLPFDIPDLGVVGFSGALRAPGTREPILPDGFKNRLLELLNTPAESSSEEPVVAPPIYGGWQTDQDKVPADGAAGPRWLRGLNLDPRYRAAAGLGARLIRDQQEELMASAWQQAGNAVAVARVRNQAKLSLVTGAVVHRKHLKKMSASRLVRVVEPMHASLDIGGISLQRTLAAAKAPGAAGALRRVIRPGSNLIRTLLAPTTPVSELTSSPAKASAAQAVNVRKLDVAMLDTRPEFVVRDREFLSSLTLMDQSAVLIAGRAVRRPTAAAKPKAPARPAPTSPRDGLLSMQRMVWQLGQRAQQTKDAGMKKNWEAHGVFLRKFFSSKSTTKPTPRVDEKSLQRAVLERTDPRRSVVERLRARLTTHDGSVISPAASLASLVPAPKYGRSMYEALAELDPNLLMSGVGDVPPDSVTLLESNPRFIEAFMVGLNHEMSRELVWRRYPSSRRGTYFRNFWNSTSGNISDIHTWSQTSRLGETIGDRKGAERGDRRLVLLVRGELLRRYPGALIYATHVEQGRTEQPVFRGSLEPDMTFLGFDLTVVEVQTGGWAFVLEQQPSEPRFGLDDSSTEPLETWADLSWSSMEGRDTPRGPGSYLRVGGSPPATPSQTSGIHWGMNSAHMANITLQAPIQISLRASTLLTTP